MSDKVIRDIWRRIELNEPLREVNIGQIVRGDANADRFVLELVENGQPVNLDDYSVSGFFINAIGLDVPITGDITDNVLTATLGKGCYDVRGMAGGFIRVANGDATVIKTVLRFTADVLSDGTGNIYDPDKVIGSVAELLAKISAMEDATRDARLATQEVRDALNSEGNAQIAAIRAEGEKQVSDTNAAGAAQITAIEEKGEQTRQSIPEEYTVLDADVKSLKDQLDDISVTTIIKEITSWTQGTINAAAGGMQVSDTRCRSAEILVTDEMETVLFDGYDVKLFFYSGYPSIETYLKDLTTAFIVGAECGYKINLVDAYVGKYMKVVARFPDDSIITPADVLGITIVKSSNTDESLTKSGKAADAKVTGDAIAALNETIGEITVESFVKTGSNNAVRNFFYPLATGEAIFVKWESSEGKAGELDLFTRDTTNGENKEKLLSAAKSGTWYKTVPTMDASYLRLGATRSGTITVIKENTVLGAVNGLDMRTSALEDKCAGEPLVRFEFSKKFNDVSAEAMAFGLTSETSKTMADVVYHKFHELAESYPGYVQEVLDAETEIDSGLGITLTKPWYMSTIAAGTEHTIQTDTEGGTYTYKTTNDSAAYAVRMYKLIQPVAALGNSGGKRKLFITGGTHGNEVVAPIDLYLLAKMLCEPNGDADLIRLRAAYDIYIIPYLNVFGGRNLMRVNGNLTDINRNFPTSGWTKTNVTDNTFANTALCVFSGVSAGSEYETQLVMALTDTIKPSIFIDHHNSGTGSSQFYTIVSNAMMRNVAYQAATDCTVAFVENLPQYFGKDYFTVLSTGGSPYVLSSANGHNGYWMDKERGIKCAGTIEVFESINFSNGAEAADKVKYTGDAFNVNYFTLKNTLLHFCRYDMEHS